MKTETLTIDLLKKHGALLPKGHPESFAKKYKNDPEFRKEIDKTMNEARRQVQTAINNAKKMMYPHIDFDGFHGDEYREARAVFEETRRQIDESLNKLEKFKEQSIQFNKKQISDILNAMKMPEFHVNPQLYTLAEDFPSGQVSNFIPAPWSQPTPQFQWNGRNVSRVELEQIFRNHGLNIKIK